MYRTQREQIGRSDPIANSEALERRKKKRKLRLSSLGELLLDRFAIGPGEESPILDPHPFEEMVEVVQNEFLVCAGGICIPTHGPLRHEEHLGVHYVVGHSTWEHCESSSHAEERLTVRIDELDPHDLASEALAIADPGVG